MEKSSKLIFKVLVHKTLAFTFLANKIILIVDGLDQIILDMAWTCPISHVIHLICLKKIGSMTSWTRDLWGCFTLSGLRSIASWPVIILTQTDSLPNQIIAGGVGCGSDGSATDDTWSFWNSGEIVCSSMPRFCEISGWVSFFLTSRYNLSMQIISTESCLRSASM